jgi:hypothetical protein
MNEQFVADVMSLVNDKPRLMNDIIGALRGSWSSPLDVPSGRRWRRVRFDDVERIIRNNGGFIRCRTYAAGIAIYAATVPFTEVQNNRVYDRVVMVPVEPY